MAIPTNTIAVWENCLASLIKYPMPALEPINSATTRPSHATPSEVAITQFAYPEAIKSAALDPPVASRGDFADAADYRRKFPDGRIGSNPALATPEGGRRLYEAAVAAIAKDYESWLTA